MSGHDDALSDDSQSLSSAFTVVAADIMQQLQQLQSSQEALAAKHEAERDEWRRERDVLEGRIRQLEAITVGSLSYEGGVYDGQLVDGQPHGNGTLRKRQRAHDSRVIYSGQWRHGKRHGQGKAYYDWGGDMLWFDGEWREGLAHSGILFPDGTWYAQKNADGSPVYPIAPIRWQAGQTIPNTDVTGNGCGLHHWLQYWGLSGYFPGGAL